MPNFYGGLKRFFNLKENTQKKDEALSAESGPDASQTELEEKLIGTQAEIKQQQLAPATLEGLSEEKKPEAEQIVKDANTDLDAVKDQSLNSLAQVEKLTFTAGVVDTTDILRGKAYRGASEQMTADKNELKGVKGFLEKIWKYNFAEQYLHEKQRVDVKKKMIESGNLYIAENLTAPEKEAAQRSFSEATLARFIPGIKELVEENLGEKREELKEGPETAKIKDDLKKIINEYADGKLDEAGFEGAKRNVFAAIEKNGNQETLKKSEMYVDNFLEIARQVKEIKDNIRLASDHRAKLAQFDFDINLVLGKAKEGVKTETHYNIAERTVEKMRQTKLGSLVNETTLAAAVGLTYSAASFLSQRVLRSKAMAIGTLGAAVGVSSAYTGIKESQMQKRERQTLEARDTTGMVDINAEKTRVAKDLMALEYAKTKTTDKKELKKINNQMKGLEAEQEKLLTQEQFLYKKKTAGELRASLETAVNVPLKSAAEVEAILNNLADIEARLELSNENKIDLVSYSSLTNVETERQKLLQAKWQAKQRLQSLAAGVSPDWEKRLKDLTVLCRQELLDDKDNGIKKKDAAFNKYKNKEILKKVAQAAAVGLTVGALAQEGFAAFSDKQEGLVENLTQGDNRTLGDRDTALETLRNFITGHDSAGNLQEVAIDNGLVKLPANCSWLHNPDGSFNLLRGSEVLAENLKVNPDGSLTEEARNILAAEHINVNASQYVIESGGTATVHTGPEDYVNKHPENFKQISRGLWYGNDTPMYKGADGKMHGADLNELRAHWGGDQGTGINLKTNSYEMTAIKMTPEGSFQTVNGEKLSENAAELIKEGKMKFLFSLSNGTQNQVIELPVDPATGKISVDRDSELGKLLFSEKNGQAVLKARFAEVATSSGIGKDGVEQVHVFATAVGEGLKGVDEIINTPPQMGTATALNIPRDWVVPPFIPVGWRTPLNKVPGASFEYGLYQGGKIDEDRLKKIEQKRSETLNKDPKAKLNHYDEAEHYLSKMDKEYREQIEALAKEAGPMSEQNKLSICIPVAGHQEGKKIYESLKNYTYQKAKPEDFEICLMVNHPDHNPEGKKIEPDETLSEIERFKKDYPEMNIKVVYRVIPYEKANIGLVRKMLNDMVLARHHKRGEKADDLIMVSNDADNLGVDPRYVENFIKRLAADPKLDGVLGQLDWDPEAYTKYPLIHIGTRLFQYYSAKGRAAGRGIVSSGANFAFKSSIYAGIGGYLDDVPGGEDVAIGQAIRLARGDTLETQSYGGSASRIFTSARRAIDVLKKHNLAPVEQWDKGFSAFDDEIRAIDLKDVTGANINYDDPAFLDKLKAGLEYMINRTLDVYEPGEKLGKSSYFYQHNLMGRLGIKCGLDAKGDVIITDMTKLVAGLKIYQKEGVLQRDARSGKIEASKELKKVRQPRQEAADRKKAIAEKKAAAETVVEKNNRQRE